MAKKILIGLASVIVSVLIVVGLLIGYIFGLNQRPRSGPDLGPGIEQVADGIATIYLFPLASGKVALIDAGNDANGASLLNALHTRGKTPDDVTAIFITHAHPDHAAAVTLFPRAAVYAMAEEAAIAEGKEEYQSPIARLSGEYNPHPFRVTHPIKDEETVVIEDLKVTAYAIPGHTPGSVVYLARGVLFLGDGASIGSNRKIRGPVWFFSRHTEQGVASLAKLLDKLAPRASEIEFVTSSHSGTLPGKEGLQALKEFVGK